MAGSQNRGISQKSENPGKMFIVFIRNPNPIRMTIMPTTSRFGPRFSLCCITSRSAIEVTSATNSASKDGENPEPDQQDWPEQGWDPDAQVAERAREKERPSGDPEQATDPS